MTRDPHDDHAADDDPEITPAQEDAVRELLGALPDPPLPADVAARIDAALVETAPPLDLHAHRTRRGHGTRLLQAAAVVVLLALGGFAVVAGLDVRDGDRPAGTSADAAATSLADAPERSDTAAPPVRRSGADYDTEDLAVRVRLVVAPPMTAASALTGADAGADSATDPDTDSDSQAYAKQDESAAPGSEAADSGGTVESRAASAPGGRGGIRALLGDDARRAACLRALTGRDDLEPLALDVGRWGGRPAGLIVVAAEDEPSRAVAWVVGPSCSAADGAFPLHRADVDLS